MEFTEKIPVRLKPTEHTSKVRKPAHGPHFRDFVQIMLCHAWSIGMLEAELWCDIPDIAEAAVLHDIGKVVMPPRLVNKNGKLTDDEREEMRQHTILGALCVDIIIPELKGENIFDYARQICFQHHERINGCGYPMGLCGEDIPIYMQIVSLADVYDALRSTRSYRNAIPADKAMKMIKVEECGAFDPELLDAFEPLLEEFRKLALTLADDPHWME